MRSRLLAIEGAPGAGKTLVASTLARRLKARLILEPDDSNPVLARFHADPANKAFQTQMAFLLARYAQQEAIRQPDLFQPVTVTNYFFEKDRIFAALHLSPADQQIYDQVYQRLVRRLAKPDLVIYLQARPAVLRRRIQQRANDRDRAFSLAYLTEMSDAFNDFFFHYSRSARLVINTSELDLEGQEADLEEVIKAIRGMKKGLHYYNPIATP